MKEFDVAIIAILSVTAASLFTKSVSSFVDEYFVTKYQHKTLIYFIFSFLLIVILVFFSRKKKI
jgi:hypothetical protein